MNEYDERFDAPAAYARFLAAKAKRPNRAPIAVAAGLAAAAVLAIVFAAPIGSFANGFLTIFQPKQFAAVDVSALAHSKNGLFPRLNDYGTFARPHAVASSTPQSVAEASAFAGYHVLTPAVVPAQIGSAHAYYVRKAEVQSFRFDAARARRSVARTGHALPPMPAGLDGTTITMRVGPIVETVWGSDRAAFGGWATHGETPRGDGMIVFQSLAPVVRSSGASLGDLEEYLLKMPGLAPEVAEQIRAIGDPSSTLPVPIVGTRQSAHRVDVAGAPGLAIGDNTGIGAGVLWQRDGYVYGVFGTLTEDQVLSVAAGLR